MNFAARVRSLSLFSSSPARGSRNWEAFILISLYGLKTPIIHNFSSHFWLLPPLVFPLPDFTFFLDVLSSHVGDIRNDKESLILLLDWCLENDWRPSSGSHWLLWSAQAPGFWTCQGPAVSHLVLAPPIFPTLSAKRHRLLSFSSHLKGTMFRARCPFYYNII